MRLNVKERFAGLAASSGFNHDAPEPPLELSKSPDVPNARTIELFQSLLLEKVHVPASSHPGTRIDWAHSSADGTKDRFQTG